MKKGNINVQTDNIFPIIKKFLYHDHEIFLRELISNAVDACSKLKVLAGSGAYKKSLEKLRVEVVVDKKNKTLTISDNGIGMSEEEVEKYINEIAFSGAKDFLSKYDEKNENSGIIGHFGLGFYSSFMVAKQVDIITKSYKSGSKAVKWSCDGTPEYTIEEAKKKGQGTDIVLHINEDDEQFLEDHKLNELLGKYCKFYPIEIKFGTKEETVKEEGEEKDDKKDNKTKEKKITVDNIVNNTEPLWKKSPSGIEDEAYKAFYRELYPYQFEDPVFSIHLNIDYPFDLTGILYFPKLKNNFEPKANKIQLYCNQVFVTDNVEGIVPEFLQHLHGVIDSPDIPLNVSRSYLQSDVNVKKISSYITKKVSEKLDDLHQKDQKIYEEKWQDLKVFVELGMMTDEKFFDKAKKFCLIKNTEGEFKSVENYLDFIAGTQTDKDKKRVIIYTSDEENQAASVSDAKNLGYDVACFDHPIDSHFINHSEQKLENTKFVRVDSEIASKLIDKGEESEIKLSEEEQKTLKEHFEKVLPKEQYTITFESMNKEDMPLYITNNEFMRRMKEMSEIGGNGMNLYGSMPDMYNVVVNVENGIVDGILQSKDDGERNEQIKQITDLALISKGLLKGEKLNNFIKRTLKNMK